MLSFAIPIGILAQPDGKAMKMGFLYALPAFLTVAPEPALYHTPVLE
jgi:hypothetical protein